MEPITYVILAVSCIVVAGLVICCVCDGIKACLLKICKELLCCPYKTIRWCCVFDKDSGNEEEAPFV